MRTSKYQVMAKIVEEFILVGWYSGSPCKKSMRGSYLSWKMAELQKSRAAGETGKLVVRVSREQLMSWTEQFVVTFNKGERTGITNIIVPCLTKLEQNIFSTETKPFYEWLESLNKNALYKALLRAHTATDL